MKSEIAVILVNYNGAQDTLECVKSLNKSVIPVDIIVVDNASTNDDVSILSKQQHLFHLIVSEENLGFAGGNNLAIKYALECRYKYIMLLNNDTIIDRDMVCRLLEKTDDTCITVPLMYFYDEPSCIWYGGGEIDKKKGMISHTYYNVNEKELVVPLKEKYCTFATGCCIVLSMDVIKKCGMLDETYFMYSEDAEYSIRLQQEGIKIRFVPSAKLWHKVSKSTGGTESYFSVYYNTRNNFRILREKKGYFAHGALAYTFVFQALLNLRDWLKGGKRYKAYIRGIVDCWKNIQGKVEL